MLPVSSFVLKNAVTRSATSEARYTTKNHINGGERISAPRNQGRRHSAAPSRSRVASRTDIRCYPSIWVQACCHCVKPTQSFVPLSHVVSGVFQNLIVLKYDCGSFAWYAAQPPFCKVFMIGQASVLAGVSP